MTEIMCRWLPRLILVALIVPGAAMAMYPQDGLVHHYSAPVLPATRVVTLDMKDATLGNDGMVCIWYGVGSANGPWIQAGIRDDWTLQGRPYLYVETNDATRYSFRILGPVNFGQSVQVRLTDSDRYGWVVWVDGRPVGSERLQGKPYAIEETTNGATADYTIN